MENKPLSISTIKLGPPVFMYLRELRHILLLNKQLNSPIWSVQLLFTEFPSNKCQE